MFVHKYHHVHIAHIRLESYEMYYVCTYVAWYNILRQTHSHTHNFYESPRNDNHYNMPMWISVQRKKKSFYVSQQIQKRARNKYHSKA